ncbi:MAG: hypothetical protein CMJ89_15265 [Planctomycetes bacterium]|jgi:general secretion pathway protein D|nr:hypothetical protein [Planctomycetota bacterium]
MKAPLRPILATLLLAPVIASRQDQETEPFFPIQATDDYYIINFSEDKDERVSLEYFVKLCQDATGLNFTYNSQTEQSLQSLNVVMFGEKTIRKEDFYPFFQIQMFINDFVCVEVGPPHISIILIQSLARTGGGQANLRARAVYVLPDELETYADQPATLITTVLHLPNLDARTIQTQLRALITDTATQSMIAVGTNSVILQGFGSYIYSLAKLLQLVDAESALVDDVQPVFDVIPLEFAAAEDVSELLEQLLEAQRSSARTAQRPRAEGQGPGGALQSNTVESKILVDGRTNSLLVMAMPDEMPRIKDLVARLDVEVVEPERNFHIYSLENVNADDLAEVLENFLSDAERLSGNTQGGTGGRAQGGGGGSSRTSNDVVVVPDPNSNTLLIAANKTRYEEVLELIRQLDQRQDQVLIESALIELTDSALFDLGVELAFADVNGDGGYGVTSFGLSTIDDLDSDGISDTRTPVSGFPFSAGILSGNNVNVPFLIAAAQNRADTNVLNIPSVLVNNNHAARVVTLDEQPTTTVTSTGVGGQTQENFNGYQEAGITMEISPSISAARYLRLDISLSVSNFTSSFTASAIPPPRITREMSTSVNIPDGDTMVIGGVVSDIFREELDGVPWISDLPLIGALFRRTTKSKNRTTLYFFVTPHILHDRDFADLAEVSYQKKLQAAEIIGSDRVRVLDPNFGIDDSVIDFDSFQVPLYRTPERGEVSTEDVGLDALRRSELLRSLDQGDGEDASENP